jgi:hypothetical protein
MRVYWAETRRFGWGGRGNIGVTSTLGGLLLVYVIGCGVDCSRVAQLRSELQAAASAASEGSIAAMSPARLSARAMTSDGAIAVGAADAAEIFNTRLSGVTGFALDAVTATVTKRGATLTADITFSAQFHTAFLRLIGRSAVTIRGVATATTTLPRIIDVDVSPRQFAEFDPNAGTP